MIAKGLSENQKTIRSLQRPKIRLAFRWH